MHIHQKGLLAEIIALIYYILTLHWPIKHRYKTQLGEIDLVFVKRGKLKFVEVKARKCQIYEGVVSSTQVKRICKAAELFMLRHPKYQDYDMQFDLALVRPYKIPQIVNLL